MVTIGWEENGFVHDCPLHFDIINGKIWVQQNLTEWEVSEMWEAHGVPKQDIVAGFLPPELREYSKYAVAWDLIAKLLASKACGRRFESCHVDNWL